MKVGVAGKGGSGKTVVAALLAQANVARGRRVLAVDTDADPNLGLSLGLDRAALEAVPPLPPSLTTGTADGRFTPEGLLDAYAVATPAGPLLLHAVGVLGAGAGCACSNHLTVGSLLGRTTEQEADLTVVDMEAGLEHLSRAGGTLVHADALVIVVEPTRTAVLTAQRIRELAEQLGIPRIYPVGNKIASPEEAAYLAEAGQAGDLAPVAMLARDPAVVEADRAGGRISLDRAREVGPAVDELVALIDSPDERRAALREELDRLDRQLDGLEQG